ncbi:MAG: hypothetical protein ABI263_03605, partial [Gelidibacter sp.]
VDLVWVNGDNFKTGQQASLWRCAWSGSLPNMKYTAPNDPLLTSDFGTPVNGCEARLEYRKKSRNVSFDFFIFYKFQKKTQLLVRSSHINQLSS